MITPKKGTKQKDDRIRKGKGPMKEEKVEVCVILYCISHDTDLCTVGICIIDYCNYIVLQLQGSCDYLVYRAITLYYNYRVFVIHLYIGIDY